MRPSFVLMTLVFSLAACGRNAPQDGQLQGHPDVLLVVVDTLRADRLSAYGYERATSPVMDSLAREGALFEDVTSQASWTLPSMVSLMQGRYVTSYRDVPIEEAPTLAEAFRDAGYRTLGVVGNGLLSVESGFDRGFDFYEARSRKIGQNGRTLPAREAAELVSDASAPLLKALERDESGRRPPVFTYLHMMDPHGPYRRHAEFDGELPIDERAGELAFETRRLQFEAERPGRAGTETEWLGIAQDIARYDQEVRTADVYIGIVLEFLEQQGSLDNTIVAIVSDHGECLWEHPSPADSLKGGEGPRGFFFQGHGNLLYEEIIATPMILWGPGIPAGRRITEAVENVDLFPTLLELAGVATDGASHGRSLADLMRGGATTGREAVYSAVLQGRSVREVDRGWKLIVPGQYHAQRSVQLFDLQTDPDELENLAQAHPEVVARLSQKLESWISEHPTATNLGRKKSVEAVEDLKALGYATGEDD